MTYGELFNAWLNKTRVKVNNHDYAFSGIVVSVFSKRGSIKERCVVENDDGVLLIQSAKNLEVE